MGAVRGKSGRVASDAELGLSVKAGEFANGVG
jgi:hypothetical protein